MGSYIEQISNHPIKNTINGVENLIESIDKNTEDYINSGNIDEFERIKRVCAYLKDQFNSVDPYLLNMVGLNNINSYLQNVHSYLSTFYSTKNNADIIQANNHLENVIREIVFIVQIRENKDIDGLRESALSFNRSVKRIVSLLEKKHEAMEGKFGDIKIKMEDVEKSISSQKMRLDNFISQAQEQNVSAEIRRNEQVNQAEAKRNSDFLSIMEEKKRQVDVEFEKVRNEVKEITQQLKTMQEEFRNELKNKVHEDTETIAECKNQAEKLVNIISNTGMVGGYQTYANDQQKMAQFWQRFTVGSFIGVILFAVVLFFVINTTDIPLTTLILRIFTISTFLILGTYSAKQASKHEKLERKYRRMELELASINPYLAELPEGERNLLIQRFAEIYFGKVEKDEIVDDVAVYNPTEFAQKIIEAIKKHS